MDINKGRNKHSRKYYKKTTKFINCVQKHSIPHNHRSRTEKLVHESIQIANLQTEKSPVHHINPESCKYYIVKRRFAVKQRRIGKNGECMSGSQEQARRCKQTHIKRFSIIPSSYVLGMDKFNKILKKKCSSEKIKKCYNPYPGSVPLANNKLFNKQSKENVCIMNNELNCGNALLFQCSAASLPPEQSKLLETQKINLNEAFNKIETVENIEKKENFSNINDLLPSLMQQVAVYRMLENLKKSNSEDTIYSSISTCSSSSSTREYYLPVSSSTDTMHVANVLTNRRLVDFPLSQEEIISKEQNINQGIAKNTYNKSNSSFSPVYQQVPLKNEILPFNNKGMNEVGLELNKSNHQIIKMLNDNNDGLLSFFPFANFSSLLTKKRSKVIKNNDQSSIGVQTQESKTYEKDEDESIQFKTIKNKRIKLSKENFAVNNNTNNNDSLRISMEKTKINSLPLITTQSCEMLRKNYKKASKEEIKILRKHLNYTHAKQKEKLCLDCNISNSNIGNITLSRPKNKSISEDVLITIKDKRNKTHQIKTGINKPKSSLCISNMKLESELPVYLKSYTNTSNDSFNASNPHFVKLNPFFDAGFKDPKISRLILSSRTLAGESDNAIHKVKKQSNFTNSKAEKITTYNSENKDPKSPIMMKMTANSSPNEENRFEVEQGCTSHRSIFSADSIIYGSNAFQKIREKFDLIKNKIKTHRGNKKFQVQESLNTPGVFTSKPSRENDFEDLKNDKQGNDNIIAPSSSFMMKENPRKISTDSFENEELPDKKKYLLLLPKRLDLNNHHSELCFQESRNDEKEETTGYANSNCKSIDVNIMNDEHKLIDNLKTSSSKQLKPSASKNELKKEITDIKYLSEKQTQVNMYLVETSEKQVGDTIFNEMSIVENQNLSAIVRDKVAQTARLDDNFSAEVKISNNSCPVEAAMSNNFQAEAIISNNNGQNEGTLLDNYGQPIILYNSSGYPITDLNGRVLKNNLGAYLLNSEKYEDVIKKQLPVFDCDLISVSNSCFNPTKVPFVKVQFKITDRCGNPVSLFNNLGWPLTNKDGFFLHDNVGKLLVEMDSFNFPLCCSNGSPIYLQNGAMLLSQKFKFIVTKSDSNSSIKSLKIGRRYKNDVVSNFTYNNTKDNKISVKTIECRKTFRPLNESNSKDFKNSSFFKPKKREQNLKHNLFLPTEVPELMHEFFDNKARPRFYSNRSQGCIPQSPIPIFDREGNRLTDENGFPLKDKYGEYMLLLDKNGIALSDSFGGPIFDSNGKQLWLKDLYHMKKCPSLNYLYDRYMPPEHPYIETSTSSNTQNTHDSSDDLIPLLDLNFENEQSSEPIMNYIKEYNINGYSTDCKQIHFVQNNLCRTHRSPIIQSFPKNFLVPANEKIYIPPPMTANVLFYESRSYQEESEHGNTYGSFSQQIDDHNVPYTYEPSTYEDNVFSEQDPQVEGLEQYDDNYNYHDQGFPENSGFHQDSEIQYNVDDNNYVVYY